MIRLALLALLSTGPKYGYQLRTDFEVATGSAWLLNIGQIYSTLQRLERDGAIVSLGEDANGRSRYELSPAGEEELNGWTRGAVVRSVSTRDELVMKILMAEATRVVEPAEVIATQRAASMQVLQEATLTRATVEGLADQLHLERLIVLTKAELRWLDIVEDQIGSQPTAADPEDASNNQDTASPKPTGNQKDQVSR